MRNSVNNILNIDFNSPKNKINKNVNINNLEENIEKKKKKIFSIGKIINHLKIDQKTKINRTI